MQEEVGVVHQHSIAPVPLRQLQRPVLHDRTPHLQGGSNLTTALHDSEFGHGVWVLI